MCYREHAFLLNQALPPSKRNPGLVEITKQTTSGQVAVGIDFRKAGWGRVYVELWVATSPEEWGVLRDLWHMDIEKHRRRWSFYLVDKIKLVPYVEGGLF